jgi:putative transposase
MAKEKQNEALEKALDLLEGSDFELSKIFEEDGLLKHLTKRLVERALQAEMSHHLGYPKYERSNTDNSRNGSGSKTIITETGKLDIDIPRDRNAKYEPALIPKRKTRFEGFDKKVLSLYAKGMSLSDIKIQLEELYNAEISQSLISSITDEVLDDVKAWQNRPLESVYPVVFFDCIVVKVKQDKRIINKSVYIALSINLHGIKDILGLWISENEGSKFWLNNFTEMKNRGLKDILIACTDNLTGMSDAIAAVYPKTEHQLCIVHQIRNSLKYVSYKHRKYHINILWCAVNLN